MKFLPDTLGEIFAVHYHRRRFNFLPCFPCLLEPSEEEERCKKRVTELQIFDHTQLLGSVNTLLHRVGGEMYSALVLARSSGEVTVHGWPTPGRDPDVTQQVHG